MKYKKGDVLIDRDRYKYKILEVLGCLYFFSDENSFEEAGFNRTEKEISEGGFELAERESWKPERGGYCWIIESVSSGRNDGTYVVMPFRIKCDDSKRFKFNLFINNVFQTEEEAEARLDEILK